MHLIRGNQLMVIQVVFAVKEVVGGRHAPSELSHPLIEEFAVKCGFMGAVMEQNETPAYHLFDSSKSAGDM